MRKNQISEAGNMKIARFRSRRNSRGQALLETVLMMPLLIGIVFNALNLGYFLFVIVNLTGATRNAAEYSILGPNSGGGTGYPAACSSCAGATSGTDVASLLYNDLTGAVGNATSASVTVCSPSLGTTAGGGGGAAYANCVTCTSSTSCGSASSGGSSSSDEDPEAGFVLNRVQVKYSFKPLIAGKLFNVIMMSSSFSSGQYTFYRTIEMRAM
jgi:Flp pilus assembly protein TadG